MTRLTILLMFFVVPMMVMAQGVPNASFESWTTDTSGQFMQPDGWHSTNEQTGVVGGISVSRDTDAYTGSYAALVQTVYVGFAGAPYAGVLTNGYYQSLGGGNVSIVGGSPIGYTPDTLSFHYKYTTSDTTRGKALIYFYKHEADSSRLVGFAQKDLDTSRNYRLMNIRIGHDSLRTAADSILIIFQSCRSLSAPLNGQLLVDGIGVTGNTGIGRVEADINVTVAPNPANNFTIITTPVGQPAASNIYVYNVDGRLVQSIRNNQQQQVRINTEQLPAGHYFVRLLWADGRFVHRNIVVAK